MDRSIKIKIELDPSVSEPEVIIRAKEETALVKDIAALVGQYCTERIRLPIEAYRDSVKTSIDQSDIIRVYTDDRKLTAWTRKGEYQIRCSLRELEELLDSDWFVRISRYEIINLNLVSGFDFSSFKGTMKVLFEDGNYSWVSRRFVRPVQLRLNVLAQRRGKSYE